jgi:hypothetical protein
LPAYLALMDYLELQERRAMSAILDNLVRVVFLVFQDPKELTVFLDYQECQGNLLSDRKETAVRRDILAKTDCQAHQDLKEKLAYLVTPEQQVRKETLESPDSPA